MQKKNNNSFSLTENLNSSLNTLKNSNKQDENFFLNSKRKDYIRWDELFMGMAILTSKRSKDPCTQVSRKLKQNF